MITNEDILNMNFYKKEKFTGSYLGMRYLIQKAQQDDADIFQVCIWPGPYNFATTPEEKKTCASFPFTSDGKQAVVDWLNEEWTSRQNEWPAR